MEKAQKIWLVSGFILQMQGKNRSPDNIRLICENNYDIFEQVGLDKEDVFQIKMKLIDRHTDEDDVNAKPMCYEDVRIDINDLNYVLSFLNE